MKRYIRKILSITYWVPAPGLLCVFLAVSVISPGCGWLRPKSTPIVSVRKIFKDTTYIIPFAELHAEAPTLLPVFIEKHDTIHKLRLTMYTDTFTKTVYANCEKEAESIKVTNTTTEIEKLSPCPECPKPCKARSWWRWWFDWQTWACIGIVIAGGSVIAWAVRMLLAVLAYLAKR